MADELDEFLRQAAQRRMQRQQEKQARQSSVPTAAPAPVPSTPNRQPAPPRAKPAPRSDFSQPRPAIFDDNTPVADRSLEPSIAQRHVTTQIDQADEGIDAYVRSTIGESSSLGNLQNSQQTKKGGKKKSGNQSEERPTIEQRPNDIVGSSELIRQLRDPKTLRMAILAHEILRRPYQ